MRLAMDQGVLFSEVLELSLSQLRAAISSESNRPGTMSLERQELLMLGIRRRMGRG
ncbi:hypothetical protein UFOVP178_10 [uncultured Caudovirales phage]|uniref:Uncharacterized protein n=1 Tax=uncultured Caudovirales phage TaxID=2100421 RepID=A0A6J7WBF7_9CAUD|nr:hypothetical protein UFOVP178_10 [uncultured Caudovirales phage]